MIKILLACSAGMSTSLLEQRMEKHIKENNYDMSVIALDSATAKNVVNEYDVILLGPQVRFMIETFQNIAKNKIVDVIPMRMYGMMDAKAVITMILELIKNKS